MDTTACPNKTIHDTIYTNRTSEQIVYPPGSTIAGDTITVDVPKAQLLIHADHVSYTQMYKTLFGTPTIIVSQSLSSLDTLRLLATSEYDCILKGYVALPPTSNHTTRCAHKCPNYSTYIHGVLDHGDQSRKDIYAYMAMLLDTICKRASSIEGLTAETFESLNACTDTSIRIPTPGPHAHVDNLMSMYRCTDGCGVCKVIAYLNTEAINAITKGENMSQSEGVSLLHMIALIAEGVAIIERFQARVSAVRNLWILSTLAAIGTAVAVYMWKICMIPEEKEEEIDQKDAREILENLEKLDRLYDEPIGSPAGRKRGRVHADTSPSSKKKNKKKGA
eukprot:GHVO01046397.1.p1 GENE.GHVO01046397.1~~GHVO01046397.1.p1  ORF type:complete len:375 (+),score=89.12 GHVO01046397.1:123-1127(+)